MAVYGNTVLREHANIISIKEDNLFETVTSVVYEEYLNYKSLLEKCKDDSDKIIIEAKLEVLYEVSIKDIINTIKELWNRFRKWIKEKINTIFKFKNNLDNRTKKAIDKNKQLIAKAKQKGLNESVLTEDILPLIIYESDEVKVNNIDKSYFDYEFEYDNIHNRKIDGLIDKFENCITLASQISAKCYDEVKHAENIDIEKKNDLVSILDNAKKEFENSFSKIKDANLLMTKTTTDNDIIVLSNSIHEVLARAQADLKDLKDSINFAYKAINKIENRIAPREDMDPFTVTLIQKVNTLAINNVKDVIAIMEKISGSLCTRQKEYTEKLEKINLYIETKLFDLL